MKKGLTILAAFLTLVGCSQQKKGEDKTPSYLVMYYSQTGATRTVAQEIAGLIDADTLSLEVKQPYDGSYQETIARCQKEMADGVLPALANTDIDLDKYDVVFLGYPIWFGNYALPVASLLKNVSFEGKKVVPFCTFGSGGLGTSTENLKKALPEAQILPGYGVRNARIDKAPAEVERFLKENGYLEGEVEKLPDYSELMAVTPEEAELFNAACGDYQYPLGTPVTVGRRITSSGTDYRFSASSKDAEGNEILSTIYVTVGNEPGSKPEFTSVER